MSRYKNYNDLIFKFDTFRDGRGELTVAQSCGRHGLPFNVGRVFWISNVPAGEERGKHAHRTCWEALVAVKGSFSVKVDNGRDTARVFALDNGQTALLIPPMVWCELSSFSPDAICLCLASGCYDENGYISDYDEFLEAVASGNAESESDMSQTDREEQAASKRRWKDE